MLRHLAGTSLLALALSTAPALAQETTAEPIPETVQGYGDSSGIDTLVTDDSAAPAPVAKTGDPVIDRLNELEAKISRLEARNKELEDQAVATQDRVQKVEVRAAKGVQPGPAPTFADVTDTFSFKPRGTFQIDYAAGHSRRGGYDFSNGTDIRRGRFGFDGTAFKVFKYRIEAEYVKGTVNLLDAYVQYTGIPKWQLTVGQHKAPYGLEANTTDAFNTFLERGLANAAFGTVGAERRVGLSFGYVTDTLNATVGVFGAGEAIGRNAVTRDEAWSVNGRVTWEPIFDTGKIVHLGVSGFKAGSIPGNALTLSDRPSSRVDGGLLVSTGTSLAPTTGALVPAAPQGGAQVGVKGATYAGAEAAVVFGPFSVQGEYNHLWVDRYGAARSVDFDGFYVFGSWFLTGESRVFKNGSVDRIKPFSNFDYGKGTWGALELAVRYDQLDLTDKTLSPLGRKGSTWTAGLNWYLNPNTRVVFNYIRFSGQNSPLYIATLPVAGTGSRTAKGDIFGSRLQFDF
jgi:phosphate-selective porin OprO/OprP